MLLVAEIVLVSSSKFFQNDGRLANSMVHGNFAFPPGLEMELARALGLLRGQPGLLSSLGSALWPPALTLLGLQGTVAQVLLLAPTTA